MTSKHKFKEISKKMQGDLCRGSFHLFLRSEGNLKIFLKEAGLVPIIFTMAIVLWVVALGFSPHGPHSEFPQTNRRFE